MEIKIINNLNSDPVLITFNNDKDNKFRVTKDQLLGDTNIIASQLMECARELIRNRTSNN
ncbi:hypothetical protein [Pediococcus stilesii]|uniref:Uncharacterized protein n=1 Tax=Pediococcus stilesii TaxID=331679 RepID=A0A0R2L456_9LACO|nr:hypothetical protein [Pediococcus stilesii]KRN94566.1 hypothetical protein IV81_GL001200 [Pediococcus stilesii]